MWRASATFSAPLDMNRTDRKDGEPDQTLIRLQTSYEVRDWAARLNCTQDELRHAVGVVGRRVANVKAFLAKKK
jgi:Protein of unknown function (DUF3606)